MRRKFDLWGFPGNKGMPFHQFSMTLSQCDEQLSIP